jgi:hypothetical protein
VEISAALHERFIPRLWGNEQRPTEEQIVIELDHLTAREMAEYEYTLNDGGIYRKMYDYNRIAKKIHGIETPCCEEQEGSGVVERDHLPPFL